MEKYDIYVVEHVEELKRDYRDLWRRFKEVVHENAELNEELDRHRREGSMRGPARVN